VPFSEDYYKEDKPKADSQGNYDRLRIGFVAKDYPFITIDVEENESVRGGGVSAYVTFFVGVFVGVAGLVVYLSTGAGLPVEALVAMPCV